MWDVRMSFFDGYLQNPSANCRLALTDSSYKKVTNDHELKTNADLGTLGDSVYRFVLTKYLYDKQVEEISNRRQSYESDEALVTKVAKHYDILQYLMYDECDIHKIGGKSYDYIQPKAVKFIATAMEAILGAVYLDYGIGRAEEVVYEWIEIIDSEE